MTATIVVNRKTSVIGEFFTVGEDTKFAICGTCKAKLPRGSDTTKSFTRTNLVHHLTAKHPEIHTKYLKRKANKELKQPKETSKQLLDRQLS